MGKINKIHQMTNNRFLNLYELDTTKKTGEPGKYYVASRAKSPQDMQLSHKEIIPDGVVMYALAGEQHDRVVLIRQFRWPLGDFVYEFPAGLVEPGEEYHEAAVRELEEETGLKLTVVPVDPMYEVPRYNSTGMTDESCAFVYGYAEGDIKNQHLEDTEEIEVVLADREEARRILREEPMAANCAYMLAHFLTDEDPFAFMRT
ncbi:MAG: NUDIX hydrolase [Lachnospiraceae bacterium]|nr:NUDIX hydrolase [Lachnospiraceae bacterium]